MFWAMIPPIFRGTRLCVTACGIIHPGCCRPVARKLPLPDYRSVTSWVHYTTSCNTQSSAPEDGWDQSPKYVKLSVIIKKLLFLHLVSVYINYIFLACVVDLGGTLLVTRIVERRQTRSRYKTNCNCLGICRRRQTKCTRNVMILD